MAVFIGYVSCPLKISGISASIFLLFHLCFFFSPCFILAVSVFFRSFVTGLKLKS